MSRVRPLTFAERRERYLTPSYRQPYRSYLTPAQSHRLRKKAHRNGELPSLAGPTPRRGTDTRLEPVRAHHPLRHLVLYGRRDAS